MSKLNILLTLVVIGATVGLFFMLGPTEKQTLFYTYLSLSIVLESIALLSIFNTSQKNKYNIHRVASTAQVISFVSLVAIWMIVYEIWLRPSIEVKWFYGGLILLSVIYIGILIFIQQGGKTRQRIDSEVKELVSASRTERIDFNRLKSKLKYAVSEKTYCLEAYSNTEKKITLFCEKIACIPLFTQRDNPSLMNSVTGEVNKLNGIIEELESTREQEQVNKMLITLSKEIEQAIYFIDAQRT